MIGNGFDLHFGLNTKPECFEEYLATKSIYNEPDNALDFFSVLWCRLVRIRTVYGKY